MSKEFKIAVGGIEAEAIFNVPEPLVVYDALPITDKANLWGDKIYFNVNNRQILNSYWLCQALVLKLCVALSLISDEFLAKAVNKHYWASVNRARQ